MELFDITLKMYLKIFKSIFLIKKIFLYSLLPFYQKYISITLLQNLYKILNEFINCPTLLLLIKFSVLTKITRNYTLLFEPFHRTNYGYHFLMSTLSRETNLMSDEIDVFKI